MKKVLVITYYWPPSGGGGVQRWLKFVKYLPEFGWEPIVYTPKNQNAPSYDKTLLEEVSPSLQVLRRPIWEPYSLYKAMTGRKKAENLGAAFASNKKSYKVVENLANWIRSNMFIPDARRFWIAPSVRFLKKFIQENKIKLVVTTGPPHSMHMIGFKLKEKMGIKWLADFRDPWTDIDYYEQLKLTTWADKKQRELEKNVLQNADMVTCVSQSNKEKLSKKAKGNIQVVTNGYDDADFTTSQSRLDKRFTIAHIGTFMANRNPEVLWDVLSELVSENQYFKNDFELHLTGKTDSLILDSVRKRGLSAFLHFNNPVSHRKAVQLQRSAQLLLITVNRTGDTKGMVTGKVFEYLFSGRPILAIGPEDGDLAIILKDTNTGVISDFDDKIALKRNIERFYEGYKMNSLKVEPKNLEKYSRKNLTRSMSDFLNMVGS